MDSSQEAESHADVEAPKLSPQELAAKLDAELDAFINGLEKKAYTDGWPEDRWQEEMEKHPFFMSKPPEPGQELSPLMEGIQQLKYDETENTPEELAKSYKDDGNFNFKCKKYRYSILAYTEGLKRKCKDDEINAQLYNNRSACNFFLKNYRSCLNDCVAALKLKPEYTKATYRAAQACFHLKQFDDCMKWCDQILSKLPNDKEARELRVKATAAKKVEERDSRRQLAAEKKEGKVELELLDAVRSRKIKFRGRESSALSLSDLEPQFPDAFRTRVHFVDDGRLSWPVIFMYPEYKLTDFIQDFHEDATFDDVFSQVFEERPEWDQEDKYKEDQLRVYFEDEDGKVHNIPKTHTLGEALVHKKYVLHGGTPGFMVLVAGSNAERQYTRPL